MKLFVDTSVWSLALRRDQIEDTPEVHALRGALERGTPVFATGVVLQELLQGVRGPKAGDRIVALFAALPLIVPDRADHVAAADIRNRCRRRGVHTTTIDVLIAQLCVRHGLTLLTTDRDFTRIARVCPLTIWRT